MRARIRQLIQQAGTPSPPKVPYVHPPPREDYYDLRMMLKRSKLPRAKLSLDPVRDVFVQHPWEF